MARSRQVFRQQQAIAKLAANVSPHCAHFGMLPANLKEGWLFIAMLDQHCPW
jgi:hypothetical protein